MNKQEAEKRIEAAERELQAAREALYEPRKRFFSFIPVGTYFRSVGLRSNTELRLKIDEYSYFSLDRGIIIHVGEGTPYTMNSYHCVVCNQLGEVVKP